MASSDIYNSPSRRKPAPTAQVTPTNIWEGGSGLGSSVTADRIHSIFMAAESGWTTDLFNLYRDIVVGDNHIQAELSKRIMAVLGDTFSVTAYNRDQVKEQEAAQIIQQELEDAEGWVESMGHLLSSSCCYPVSLVEKVYAPSADGYRLAKLVPVPHCLLDFRDRRLMIYDVADNGRILTTSHEPDPARYIIHKGNLLTAPAWFGGPMRALVVWWMLKTMSRSWWARFLDRFGSPFLVGHYNTGDQASKNTLESAFSWATRIGGLVVSDGTKIDVQQASQASGDAFEKFITVANREISKLLVGQTLSAEAQSTGLGSGVANSQEAVRQDIRMFDASMLASTIRRHLIDQMCEAKGITVPTPMPKWGSVSPAELRILADLLSSLNGAGLEIADDALEPLSDMVGWTLQRTRRPTPGLASFNIEQVAGQLLDAGDGIVNSGVAGLTQAFGNRHAELAQIIRSSSSANDALRLITAALSGSNTRAASAVENALAASAANAFASPN